MCGIGQVFSAKPGDPLVMGHERTVQLDRGGDQKSVGGLAVFEHRLLTGAGGRAPGEWCGFDARSRQEQLDPVGGGKVQRDATGIGQQRDLPTCHPAQIDC